ncbi:hypothetical protein [Methylobacterium gnaphalii]|uniref:hypothetical protein n=1 Tax=Methylobacterium gnaphalii TaxID=1010610 RepID=UPI0011BFD2D2|nr:hypothetical protein [Methylobacterium gnaphalii]GJD69249.1 hypothetical protein MMMDOFMJ_2177 [Methylobacterium gnaphalii]
MSTSTWLPLLAFLAPIPPMRPEPERTPPGWLPGFLMAALTFILVAPMIAIWSFHRPEDALRAECAAAGGKLVYRSVSGDRPPKCSKP